MTSEYWQKILSSRMSRRRLLKVATLAGGTLGASAILEACSRGQRGVPGITPRTNETPAGEKTGGASSTENPTSQPNVTGEPVATTEAAEEGEAIFNLGNLRLELNDWLEPDRPGTVGINGVFGKPVEIKAVVRNLGQTPVDLRIFNRSEENLVFEFNLRSKDGQLIENLVPTVNQDFVEPGVLEQPASTQFHQLLLPPGFGIPVVIKSEIPKDLNDYKLGVESYDLAMPAPDNFIAKGQTVKSAPLVGPNVQRRNWTSFEKVNFGGDGQISLIAITTKRGGSEIGQDVKVSIFNHLDKDIYLPGGWIKVLVFLRDGRVSYGSSKQKFAGGDVIEPSNIAFYSINIGFTDTANPQLQPLYHYELFDFSDSVILVTAYDKWAAWRITESDWQLMDKGNP